MRFWRAGGCKLCIGLSSSNRERGEALRAVGGSNDDEGQEEDGDEDVEDITDDALRATIRKSKKVLAIQRNLLQQVLFQTCGFSPKKSVAKVLHSFDIKMN